MYKFHLILKYLFKRRIAWVSLLAVCLCTTMVLVVMSVMGGWLRMARENFHGLSGDIIIQSPSLSGFAYYKEIMAELEKKPDVEAVSPVIQTFGLININNRKTMGVQVLGYPMDRIGQINGFTKSLWRQWNQWIEWADGAPIALDDRREIRRRHGLDVRDSDDLLRLNKSEVSALTDALSGMETKAKEFAAKSKTETNPGEQSDLIAKASRMQWLITRTKEYLRAGDKAVMNESDRDDIRRLVGKIVDDPAVRLKPDEKERGLVRAQAMKMNAEVSFKPFRTAEEYKASFKWQNPRAKQGMVDSSANFDGLIAGTGVVNVKKNSEGKMSGRDEYLYEIPVKLTVMGVAANGNFDMQGKAEHNYWIVDTSRTKVWQYDSNSVYVPFDILQVDLGMEEREAELDGQKITLPARTSEVHVRLRPGVANTTDELLAARDRVEKVVEEVFAAKRNDAGGSGGLVPIVRTWEQSQSKWLQQIEKELVLITGLFGLISIVAVFLIFCIFYMIVVEKTRDIGIIKSVGATSSGVAGIFLGYGAAIGIVGAGMGLLLGYLIVHNINTLHDWLGKALGVKIWDPELYIFDTIPNTLEPTKVVWICSIAVLSSIIGALVPAIRAARMNPVEALRWE